MNAAVNLALQQASGFQDAEMLGDRGKRYRKGRGQFGDRGVSVREAGKDGAAGRIGQSAKGGVEGSTRSPASILNHMVLYGQASEFFQ